MNHHDAQISDMHQTKFRISFSTDQYNTKKSKMWRTKAQNIWSQNIGTCDVLNDKLMTKTTSICYPLLQAIAISTGIQLLIWCTKVCNTTTPDAH